VPLEWLLGFWRLFLYLLFNFMFDYAFSYFTYLFLILCFFDFGWLILTNYLRFLNNLFLYFLRALNLFNRLFFLRRFFSRHLNSTFFTLIRFYWNSWNILIIIFINWRLISFLRTLTVTLIRWFEINLPFDNRNNITWRL
jgi:hypothetical protein